MTWRSVGTPAPPRTAKSGGMVLSHWSGLMWATTPARVRSARANTSGSFISPWWHRAVTSRPGDIPARWLPSAVTFLPGEIRAQRHSALRHSRPVRDISRRDNAGPEAGMVATSVGLLLEGRLAGRARPPGTQRLGWGVTRR